MSLKRRVHSVESPLNMSLSNEVSWLPLMDRLPKFVVLPLNILAGREVI